MRPSQAHFVTSCQQLLALGVVLAVLTPAASVISLDVVQPGPRLRPPRRLRTGGGGRAAPALGVRPVGRADLAASRRRPWPPS